MNLGAIATGAGASGGGGGGGGGVGNVLVMVRTPTSPSFSRLTDRGDALGPLDAPGHPASTEFSLSAGLHVHAYDTDCAPPLAVSVATRRDAYRRLTALVRNVPDPDSLADLLRGAGLVDVRYRRLGLGAVALHSGTVPPG